MDHHDRQRVRLLNLRMLETDVLPFKPVGSCGRKGSAEEDRNLALFALQTTTKDA